MSGILYVIGVGPGDPELLTVKAVRILKQVKCVCVPKAKEEGSSLALGIVRQAVSLYNKEIIEAHFPMRKTTQPQSKGELDTKWQETAGTVLRKLNNGTDVAFITLGDPAIYSTFFYLYDRLLERSPDLKVEIIPGVSSITAAASKAGLSLGLGVEKIAILPAAYLPSPLGGEGRVRGDFMAEVLAKFDTVVLMKVHHVFNDVLKVLQEADLLDKAVYIVKAGTKEEQVFKDLRKVAPGDLDYFSMVIIRK